MYTSDLTEAQKSFIRETIPMDKWTSKYDFFSVFDAILYIEKTGCQWRNLPHDFPVWQTVYYYFRAWCAIGEFQKLLDTLVAEVRVHEGQPPEPSVAVVDAQSVRAASYPSPKSFDGNKKVKGIKRQIAVDSNGHLRDRDLFAVEVGKDSRGNYMLINVKDGSTYRKQISPRQYAWYNGVKNDEREDVGLTIAVTMFSEEILTEYLMRYPIHNHQDRIKGMAIVKHRNGNCCLRVALTDGE